VGQACPPWLEYFTQGINKYCALLDEPRPAPTSQVGVVTELLVISREAQELVEVHAELLRQIASLDPMGGSDNRLPDPLIFLAGQLSKRSGQASVAYELVKVGQRCEVLKWIGERAGGGVAVDAPHNYAHRAWTAPDPPGLIAAALKALSTR